MRIYLAKIILGTINYSKFNNRNLQKSRQGFFEHSPVMFCWDHRSLTDNDVPPGTFEIIFNFRIKKIGRAIFSQSLWAELVSEVELLRRADLQQRPRPREGDDRSCRTHHDWVRGFGG